MAERLPPLNALRSFEMAGRYLNVARAAQELNVSQGAVSQQVRQLEKWLGCPLFRRSNRGLDFTKAGADYFKVISQSFDEIRGATSTVSRPEIRKNFVISVTASFAMKWLIPRLIGFRELWPDVDVSVSTVELIGSYSAADGDVGIRYGTGDYPGMKSWELIRDELILVAQPGVSSAGPDIFSIDNLPHYPLLLDRHPKVIEDYPSWEDFLEVRGLHVPDSLTIREFSQQWMVIESAANGEGIALVKSCLVADDIKSGKLCQISPERIPLKSAYHLVCLPENANDRIVRDFRNWIINHPS